MSKTVTIIIAVLLLVSICALALSSDVKYYIPISFTNMLSSFSQINFNFNNIRDFVNYSTDIINNDNSQDDDINGSTLNDALNYFSGGPTSYSDPVSASIGIVYGFFLEGLENILPTEEIIEGGVALVGLPIALVLDAGIIFNDVITCISKLFTVREAPEGWKPAVDLTQDWFNEKYGIGT